MKATILQEDLQKALTIATRVVASKGQLPVLANVLIEADANGVVIAGTNLELGMRVFAGGKTEQEGSVTIPAKNLAEFVGALAAGPVELKTEGDVLTVASGKFEASFTGIPASEFPSLPTIRGKEGKIVSLKKQTIEEIATHVAFSAATDEARPVLTGVLFKSEGDNLVAIATDGFRLSKKILVGGQIEGASSLILPARTILELGRLIAEGKKESVDMDLVGGNSQVVFGYDKYELVSRILEGNFPDVDRIIPVERKTEVIMDRDELLRAVRAVSIFARESNNVIKLAITDTKVHIKATGGQTGKSDVDIDAEVKGEETGEVAFNFRYVIDFLSSVQTDRVIFITNGPLAPGIWKSEADEGLLHIIMPVRI